MKINQYKNLIIIIGIFLVHPLAVTHVHASLNSYIVFRDTVYMQNRSLLDTMRLYTTSKQDIENTLSGAERYLALARCEFLMGIMFKAENRNSEAAAYFEQGIAFAENSIALSPTSEGYLLLGSGISFLCEVRTSYGLRNHGKVLENAQRALDLDPNNLMAQHLIASYYIVAPWPITNVRRGEAMLRDILNQNYLSLDKDDQFNLYLMLQLVCIKQKKNQEAQMWCDRGATVYPTNNFISLLVK